MAGGLPQTDRQAVIALMACEALSVLLLILSGRISTQAFQGIQAAVLAPANVAVRWAEGIAISRSEATRLRSEIAVLEIERNRLREAGIENRRLRALLGFAERGRPILRPVQVVGVAGEPWPIIYQLGAGEAEGLRVGQAVLSPEGLVGRLTRVDARTASVALLTDPNAPVAGEVLGTGVRGVVKFRFEPEPGLYLTAVPLTDTVQVGQRVATSVISAVYPPGIPVARVVRVGRDPSGLLSEILVEPFAPLSRLREVLVAVGTVNPAWWPTPRDTARAAPDSLLARADTSRARAVARSTVPPVRVTTRADSVRRP